MVTNFQPSLKGTDRLRNTGSFRYVLATTLPAFSLNSADLDSVISRKSTSRGTTVIKTIYDLSLYPIDINPDTIDIGSLVPLATLTSLNGVDLAPQPLNGATQILVIDSLNIASQDRLTNHQNSFTQTYTATPPEDTEAPGPLPLMGAGAAFGFSRRMRHRLG